MERFVGKIAVVTGSSTGIGRAIVKELVKKGLIVAGLARNVKNQQDLEDEIRANEAEYIGKFIPFKCDVSQEQEIRDTFAKIRSQIGDEIAVLINNAGVLENKLQLLDVEIGEFDRVFLTNAKAMLLCAKEAIKSMTENNISGHIININTIDSIPEFNITMLQLYGASKHSTRIFSHGLRRELKEKKSTIKVSDISPGDVDTNMYRSFSTTYQTRLELEYVLAAEDIARACIQMLDTPIHVHVKQLAHRIIFITKKHVSQILYRILHDLKPCTHLNIRSKFPAKMFVWTIPIVSENSPNSSELSFLRQIFATNVQISEMTIIPLNQ